MSSPTARTMLIEGADLGPGWSSLGAPYPGEVGPCISSSTATSPVQIWITNSTYELQPDGTEHGHFAESLWSFKAGTVPDDLRAYTSSTDYGTCGAREFASDTADYATPGVAYSQVGSSGTSEPFALPAPGDAWRFTVNELLDGHPRTSTKVRVHLYGRSRVLSISFAWCTCAPFPEGEIPNWIAQAWQKFGG